MGIQKILLIQCAFYFDIGIEGKALLQITAFSFALQPIQRIQNWFIPVPCYLQTPFLGKWILPEGNEFIRHIDVFMIIHTAFFQQLFKNQLLSFLRR